MLALFLNIKIIRGILIKNFLDIGGKLMYLLLFILVAIIVYIHSFKSDFSQDKIQKVEPILIAATVILLLLLIFSSIIKH
jgi:hypothetical protein